MVDAAHDLDKLRLPGASETFMDYHTLGLKEHKKTPTLGPEVNK